jgi:hypothetical protein
MPANDKVLVSTGADRGPRMSGCLRRGGHGNAADAGYPPLRLPG